MVADFIPWFLTVESSGFHATRGASPRRPDAMTLVKHELVESQGSDSPLGSWAFCSNFSNPDG